MLQSLQTIQVDDEQSPVQGLADSTTQMQPFANISEQRNQPLDNSPEGLGYLIKPFEESIGKVSADGQTAVKVFDPDGEDFIATPLKSSHSKSPSPAKQSNPKTLESSYNKSYDNGLIKPRAIPS